MELGIFVNKIADSIGANRGVASILDNPIYTALLMTFVIMLMLFFSGGMPTNRLKTAFYIFFALLAIIFVYHRRFQIQQKQGAHFSELRSALATQRTIPSIDRVPIIAPVYATSLESVQPSMPIYAPSQTTSSLLQQ